MLPDWASRLFSHVSVLPVVTDGQKEGRVRLSAGSVKIVRLLPSVPLSVSLTESLGSVVDVG